MRAALSLALVLVACRAEPNDAPPPGPPHFEPTPAGRSAVVIAEDARIDVALAAHAPLAIGDDAVLEWVRRSAHAVAVYFGRFPVPALELTLATSPGRDVSGGRAQSWGGPRIEVSLGVNAGQRALDGDWVLVHEMTHLATPAIPDGHEWLEEGIASYVEPIARVQAGLRTARSVVREWVRDMPQGQPAAGDLGLDRTHTWERTYWGGALWCLAADVAIRERTAARFGLQDALRGALRELGGGPPERTVEEVLAAGDRATGTSVLTEMYARHAEHAVPIDLAALWRTLGIRLEGRRVELDESPVRDAIFAAPTTR